MKYLYIYNVEQSNYYIQNKIYPIEVGMNRKTMNVWFKFSKEETNEVYSKWLIKCEEFRSTKKVHIAV